MSRSPVSSALALFLLCFGPYLKAAPQDSNQSPPAPATAAASYPNSPDGLKQLIVDILAAMESQDYKKASELLSSLAIPANSAWFAQEADPTQAPRFEAEYEGSLHDTLREIAGRFQNVQGEGGTEIRVRALTQPTVEPRLTTSEVTSHHSPNYTVSGLKPKEKYPIYIGDFSYVDGGFRFANERSQFPGKSSLPPTTADVRPPKIIKEVPPDYPEAAKALHTTGVVVLHAIIGTDGKLMEMSLVKGDPMLVPSAFEAVRQWKYQPALLNGMPSEVSTTISVQFNLD